ncbi:uncharacterized protein LOC115064020 [Mus pahari]|nr:uncharacterized protein LOC115064020 [Mus pahari]
MRHQYGVMTEIPGRKGQGKPLASAAELWPRATGFRPLERRSKSRRTRGSSDGCVWWRGPASTPRHSSTGSHRWRLPRVTSASRAPPRAAGGRLGARIGSGLRSARRRSSGSSLHGRLVPPPPASPPPPRDAHRRLPCRRRLRRLGTGCMIRPQSSMSRHIPQFCGVLGHTFMEFLKGSGDYCQAQHDLYADK